MTVYAKAAVVHNDLDPYLTADKEYMVVCDRPYGFDIIDDTGVEISCLWRGCAHLDGHNWERIER